MSHKSAFQEKKYFKRMQGMIVPQRQRGEDALAFLSADGQTFPLLKSEKYELMRNLLWDSVSVLGRLVEIESEPRLEVLYFSFDLPPKEILYAGQTLEHASANRKEIFPHTT